MKSVLVGLSGGVDSALTAALLKEKGYRVIGAYCEMHAYSEEGRVDAKAVADRLGIEFSVLDLQDRFREIVIQDFLDRYTHAETPNPCVLCNPTVKFNALLSEADRRGIDCIATGHYADLIQNPENGRYAVRAVKWKDQSYMLCRLTQEQLSRTVFPLADTEKNENRELADQRGIEVSKKPDSQEICFIQKESYADYIEQRLGRFPEGEFWLAEENRPVGRHSGLIRYTVGQRKNLGISLGTPVYVVRLDPEKNRVWLSRTDLKRRELFVRDPVFQALSPETSEFEAEAKIRYSAKTAHCRVSRTVGGFYVLFDEPQRAVTPGQSAVFYRDGIVLCSGYITDIPEA